VVDEPEPKPKPMSINNDVLGKVSAEVPDGPSSLHADAATAQAKADRADDAPADEEE